MKKNVKVIIMKAKAPNGNDRVYRTMGSLEMTVADACKMRNIPMLSILSATISEPMTEADAATYMMNDFAAQVLAPNTMLVKGTFARIAA